MAGIPFIEILISRRGNPV